MKVCVADDELEVRRGIIRKIKSIDPEAEIFDVGFGFSALKGISDVMPDLAFLDIRMPELDGLELLAEVRRIRPSTRLIILSGYHEFEYARRALQLGAMDYLLKPADPAQLARILLEVRSDMERRLLSELDSWALEWQDRHILISGMQIYSADQWFDPNAFKLIRFGPAEAENAIVAEWKERLLCTFYVNGHALAAVCKGERSQSGSFSEKEDIRSLFPREWERWEASRFFAGGSHPRRQSLFAATKKLHESGYLILSHARAGRLNELGAELEEWLNHAGRLELPQLRKEVAQLMALLDEGLIKSHDIVVLAEDKIGYWLEWLRQFPDWRQLADGLRALVLSGVQALQTLERESGEGNVLDQAEAIIRRTPYAELSLEHVATSIGVHPVTLSRLFKKEAGMNFVQYLTRHRLEQARILLLSSKKTAREIAEGVGYTDYRYFCSLFKKEFGHLPREYRRR